MKKNKCEVSRKDKPLKVAFYIRPDIVARMNPEDQMFLNKIMARNKPERRKCDADSDS